MGIFKEFHNKIGQLNLPEHMLQRASIGFNDKLKPIIQLLDQQKIPEIGWDDEQINLFLTLLNFYDTDKDPKGVQIGEREARISTPILGELCGGFCHGVGRSGNLNAPQPKAMGASVMQNLTNKIVFSLIKSLGLTNIKSALTIPMGTGMSLGLAIKGTLNHYDVDLSSKPHILYCRADHKSPIKGIEYIGGKILTIDGKVGKNHYAPDGVYIDLEDIRKKYDENKDSICCIVSTTSFFSPRVPDNIKEIAKFAKENNLIHIINNAYGLQSQRIINLIRSAIDAGRIDAIVQSTDKNFLTPVGGAIVISPKKEILSSISESYAGRASASPIVQLLISLLHMGEKGYKDLLNKQKEHRKLLEVKMKELADELNESIIQCENDVSLAMTLSNFTKEEVNKIGPHLYNLRITGPRVVDCSEGEDLFGTCSSKFKTSYLVINAAIGVEKEEILGVVKKLQTLIKKIKT